MMRGRLLSLTLGAVAVSWLAVSAEAPPDTCQKSMQKLGKLMSSMRGSAEAKEWPAIAADAASVKTTLKSTETFWETRKFADAITHSKNAFKAATDIETAAKAKNEEGITAGLGTLNRSCNSCHTAHRMRTADGKYEIK